MLHKTDKDLSTIISTVKGVRILLDRELLASILGIADAGNTISIDSNKKTIDEDSDWNYDATCDRLEIWPRSGEYRYILHGGNFCQLLPRVLTYFFGHTLVRKGDGQSDVRIIDR